MPVAPAGIPARWSVLPVKKAEREAAEQRRPAGSA